jgi:hypothetical protein
MTEYERIVHDLHVAHLEAERRANILISGFAVVALILIAIGFWYVH